MLKEKIGFIGAGKMGEALIKGILRANLSTNDTIMASDTRQQSMPDIRE